MSDGVDMRYTPRAACVAAAILVLAACSSIPSAQVVPTAFDHDRIFVVAPAPDGPPVRFYTDSGGGPNVVRRSAALRLGLPEIGALPKEGEGDQAPRILVAFPQAMTRAGIPPPADDEVFKGGLWSAPDEGFPFEADGFLGSRWFRDRTWEFDYPRHTLKRVVTTPTVDATHRIALGFQTDERGARTTNFARLAMSVDGEPLDMLFDTGATVTLSAPAAARFSVDGGAHLATSFITTSVFDRWVARHPDWRVIADADVIGGRTFAMIEVPELTIAGHTVGPVWFTKRPDGAFHTYMATMMDRPVEGALGGSAFHYFRITIDYRAAVATFER